jgi:hypothetical protein
VSIHDRVMFGFLIIQYKSNLVQCLTQKAHAQALNTEIGTNWRSRPKCIFHIFMDGTFLQYNIFIFSFIFI